MRKPILILVALLLGGSAVFAQSRAKRAKLPEFTPAATQGVFFENVFEQGLQGPRPANLGQYPAVASNPGVPAKTPLPANGPGNAGSDGSSGTAGLYSWTKIISSTTIEDEIKALKSATDQTVTTPTKFAGGDYRAVRRDFSVLAMLFAIIAEYDGDVRWKDSAPAARDLFARTAANAKVGTSQVYNEAKQRRDQLGDLLNGSKIEGPGSEPKAAWGAVADRAPLMQKLELAFQGKVLPGTSNPAAFKENKSELKQHAEIIAAVAEVLKQEGMEDAGDSDYEGHSEKMKAAALEIVEAVANDNQEAAGKAAGQIGQACSQCHESYRA
jgi:cytochrome c556